MATTLAKISIKDSSSWNTYLNLIYPVGSVYFSYTSTSPATSFGGTWSQLSGNRYLRMASDVSAKGNSSVSHYHALTNGAGCLTSQGTSVRYRAKTGIPSYTLTWSAGANNWGGEGQISINTTEGIELRGNSNSTSITLEPLYQDLYCWRRTA